MKNALVLAVVICLAGVGSATAASASPSGKKAPIRVTFIGDSVAASISYAATAQAQLKKGLAVRLDLRVCRRLVQPSCTYQGSTPTTALQAVQALGRSLGRVLIVNVGYNESAQGYREGIDRVMRAALAQGAAGVVWVTLKETSDTYHWTNLAIKTAAKRWPQLVVADWNAFSAGKPWFGSDGLHMSATGATELARFLRLYVFRAAAARS